MSLINNQQTIIVSAIVKNGQEILLKPNNYSGDLQVSKWQIPGGEVEFGEDPEAAVLRIFSQKFGLEIVNEGLVRTLSYMAVESKQHVIELVYVATLAHQNGELSGDLEWVAVDQITQNDISEETIKTLKAAGISLREPKTNADKSTTNHETLHVFTDGGSRGNPGPSASGYVIMTTDETILEEGGEYLGVTTNNQAEYQAVKLALQQSKKYSPREVRFFIDSLLVVNQMNGDWKIKNRELWPIHQAIKDLIAEFEKVTFTHVRREYNKLADAQVNIVLDSQK